MYDHDVGEHVLDELAARSPSAKHRRGESQAEPNGNFKVMRWLSRNFVDRVQAAKALFSKVKNAWGSLHESIQSDAALREDMTRIKETPVLCRDAGLCFCSGCSSVKQRAVTCLRQTLG